MNLGDLVPGPFPTNYQPMTLFPGSQALISKSDILPSSEELVFPQSIGQDAGRYAMKGPLPGRYYGADWLAPNSGRALNVEGAIFSGNGAFDGPPAETLDAAQQGGPIGGVTLTNPLPSIVYPRTDQASMATMDQGFTCWLNRNPILAVGGAVALFLLLRGKK